MNRLTTFYMPKVSKPKNNIESTTGMFATCGHACHLSQTLGVGGGVHLRCHDIGMSQGERGVTTTT